MHDNSSNPPWLNYPGYTPQPQNQNEAISPTEIRKLIEFIELLDRMQQEAPNE